LGEIEDHCLSSKKVLMDYLFLHYHDEQPGSAELEQMLKMELWLVNALKINYVESC